MLTKEAGQRQQYHKEWLHRDVPTLPVLHAHMLLVLAGKLFPFVLGEVCATEIHSFHVAPVSYTMLTAILTHCKT